MSCPSPTTRITADLGESLTGYHSYMARSTDPGVTMLGDLMNHTNIIRAISVHMEAHANISAMGLTPPIILGETNSLSGQGLAGVSNAFGAAMWSVGYHLQAAVARIKRIHLHQGVSYRYASWQPVETNITTISTRAPYYGQVAAAAFLGSNPVKVADVPLSGGETEAAYAAYEDGQLARCMVINFNPYHSTVDGDGPSRPSVNYTFSLPDSEIQNVTLHRLWANGSDALSGVTWDGWSYNYELDDGRPVRMDNVTIGETVDVRDGSVTVTVPHSSALMLSFDKGDGSSHGPPQVSSGSKLKIPAFRLFG